MDKENPVNQKAQTPLSALEEALLRAERIINGEAVNEYDLTIIPTIRAALAQSTQPKTLGDFVRLPDAEREAVGLEVVERAIEMQNTQGEAMAMEQVRNRLRKAEVEGGTTMWAGECGDLVDAIDSRLTQPTQAVDVGAIREVAFSLSDEAKGYLSQKLIRAISGGKVGARPQSEWHEDDGPVLWWIWNPELNEWLGEPACIGTPLDSDWQGTAGCYELYWTPHPAFPASPAPF